MKARPPESRHGFQEALWLKESMYYRIQMNTVGNGKAHEGGCDRRKPVALPLLDLIGGRYLTNCMKSSQHGGNSRTAYGHKRVL